MQGLLFFFFFWGSVHKPLNLSWSVIRGNGTLYVKKQMAQNIWLKIIWESCTELDWSCLKCNWSTMHFTLHYRVYESLQSGWNSQYCMSGLQPLCEGWFKPVTAMISAGVHLPLHLYVGLSTVVIMYIMYVKAESTASVINIWMFISPQGCNVHSMAVYKTHYPLARKQVWIRPKFDIHLLRDFNALSIVKPPRHSLENCALMN